MSASLAGVRFSVDANMYINAAMVVDAMTERSVIPQVPIMIIPATARACMITAPPPSPNMWGSPSGLRVADCSSAPDVAKAAPASSAAAILGNRNWRTIMSAVVSVLLVNKVLRICCGSICAAPNITPMAHPTIIRMAMAVMALARRGTYSTPFTSSAICSTASAIRGPCALRKSTGSISYSLPSLYAVSPENPGMIPNTADSVGAGGGAGLIANMISGSSSMTCSADTLVNPGNEPACGMPSARLVMLSDVTTAPG